MKGGVGEGRKLWVEERLTRKEYTEEGNRGHETGFLTGRDGENRTMNEHLEFPRRSSVTLSTHKKTT